jgi:ABC-type glycerol-3-phosphate transport system permease component
VKNQLGRIVPHVFLGLTAVTVLFPLYFMVSAALKSDVDYTSNKLGPPNSPTLHSITAVLQDPNLATWAWNSVLITVGSVAAAVGCSLLAAYGIARGSSRGFRRLLTALIALMAVPPVILVVPLFSMFADLGLLNNRGAVITTYAGLLAPLAIYLFTNFFEGIPEELDEAAIIDGATRFAIFRHVILPLAKPAILTVGVVGGVYVWNEFLIALLFLQGQESQTLIVGLTSFQGRYDTQEPLLMAWSLVASVPIIAVYVFGQRYLMRGLTSGALK